MLSLNTGDTGFVMLCTALVCMMTPALALFYGGMVRKKNVLTIMMQNFISMGVTAIIWIFGGFSLAFGPDVGGLFGDISYHFALDKVGIAPSPVYASTVPFILFFAYQLMFAVIAPALITGAFAGRLNFRGYLKFLILLHLQFLNQFSCLSGIRSLDLGRRLPRQDRRNGLCGRYRDPRQRRFCGACLGHFPRTA